MEVTFINDEQLLDDQHAVHEKVRLFNADVQSRSEEVDDAFCAELANAVPVRQVGEKVGKESRDICLFVWVKLAP